MTSRVPPLNASTLVLYKRYTDEAVRMTVYYFREYLKGLLSPPMAKGLEPMGEEELKSTLAVELGALLDKAYKLGYEDGWRREPEEA